MTASQRKLGVEEEFQIIDATTRDLAPRAVELLERLPRESFVEEMQECVVELNSAVHAGLDDLRAELRARRQELSAAAGELGLAVAAAGAMPLSAPGSLALTDTERFRRMLADYELLAREQLICGTQVHVDVASRDEAIGVSNRVAEFLPIFLALSASSPFWKDGTDTGYASVRSLVWNRWPTSGPTAPVATAAEYEELVAGLVRSGVISDAGMVYYDLRPGSRASTLELRVCDSCPSVDTIALIAGLFRALVEKEAAAIRTGVPFTPVNPTIMRAAMWRAARSGLEGNLLDIRTSTPKPAAEVLAGLIEYVRAELTAYGDYDLVRELVDSALLAGSSAFRQRRALRRRGSLMDVVDLVSAETAGTLEPTAGGAAAAGLYSAYIPLEGVGGSDSWDEAIDEQGAPRTAYRGVFDSITSLGTVRLRSRQIAAERDASVEGVTFRITGTSNPQVFPMDMVPRVVTQEQWAFLSRGIEQRALAINAFLQDIYARQEIVKDKVIPPELIDRAPGFRRTGRIIGPVPVRAHICGVDLICTGDGSWVVLEDNVRVPSGIAYAMAHRTMMQQQFPELVPQSGILDPQASWAMIRETLLASAPPAAGDSPVVALVSSGKGDGAWYEHALIARQAGLLLVTPDQLVVRDGELWRHSRSGQPLTRIDVMYVRMEEDMLLSSLGADGHPLREGLFDAVFGGTLAIANSLGNGVADDKAIYAVVPQMIEYYLGEKPVLAQVPTYLCAERPQRDAVLERLDQLVVKPIDGYGGAGITIGPESSEAELAARREELLVQPERFIAQEVLALSTLPTFDGVELQRRHVDLRAFVHVRPEGQGTTAVTVPAALTRVAPAGSLIINSSRGGGGKDTWLVARAEA